MFVLDMTADVKNNVVFNQSASYYITLLLIGHYTVAFSDESSDEGNGKSVDKCIQVDRTKSNLTSILKPSPGIHPFVTERPVCCMSLTQQYSMLINVMFGESEIY